MICCVWKMDSDQKYKWDKERTDMDSILKKPFAQTDKWVRRFLCLLFIGAVLVNLKSIFADYDIDASYAVIQSYRMLRGDRMFSEMWEPHQTSAFLVTFLMWCYHSIFKTWTGVVIFLHVVGVLIQGMICMTTYKVFSRYMDPHVVSLICVFLLAFRPKAIVFPEFSNMQIFFSVLLFLCLLLFLEDQDRWVWLIAASFCLSLQVISYPSCVVAYFSVIFVLGLCSEKKLVNIALITISCFLQGTVYVSFFVYRMGIDGLVSSVRNILEADGSHGSFAAGIITYHFLFIRGVLWLAGCFLVTLLIEGILIIFYKGIKKTVLQRGKIRNQLVTIFSLVLFLTDVVNVLVYRGQCPYIAVFLLILLLGVAGMKYCSPMEKRIYTVGMFVSGGSFFAVLMLTNLDIWAVVAYLVLAIMVSFLPAYRWLSANRMVNVIFLFCAMVLMHRGLIVKSMDRGNVNIFDVGGIISSGPASGIITGYMGAYEEACDIEDWGTFVMPGDNLLLVGSYELNVMPYLYEDVTISAPSTICTPTYDETLLKYWEQYPEKFPTVIAVSCWYGDLKISEDSWIYQWIIDEFQPNSYEDGRYWRFYRLEETP